ncbi:MAG: glycosyltransferase family 1 protein, partial [candidate division Zixibacteria bacterium]|nr:glycosyltransferase family 1 protein [candidate division Zixibacteria bacterium]
IPANYGGFETCAEQTAVRFARQHDVFVYCRVHNCTYDSDSYLGVSLVKLGSINKKGIDTLSHTFRCVLDIICRKDIEIVHLYNAANAIFIPILKIAGKKVVISVDGIEWKRQKWGNIAKAFFKLSEFICTKTADSIICDSRTVQQYYHDRFKCRTEYIPYGAEINYDISSASLDKFGLKPREYLLFIGRLVPEKGVHNLISAYNQLRPRLPLIIIGDAPEQPEYVASLKKAAGDNIRFLGYVYGDDYQALNRYPYLYLTASMLEGTSPALVAAMGAGNCVLVNGIPENLETIGQAGFAAKENDISDFAAKLKFLLDNPAIVEQYRVLAFRRVNETYNWDKISDSYLNLFNSILGYNRDLTPADKSRSLSQNGASTHLK